MARNIKCKIPVLFSYKKILKRHQLGAVEVAQCPARGLSSQLFSRQEEEGRRVGTRKENNYRGFFIPIFSWGVSPQSLGLCHITIACGLLWPPMSASPSSLVSGHLLDWGNGEYEQETEFWDTHFSDSPRWARVGQWWLLPAKAAVHVRWLSPTLSALTGLWGNHPVPSPFLIPFKTIFKISSLKL